AASGPARPLLRPPPPHPLPRVAAPGSTEGAVGPTEAARYLYGAAIVLVLLYAPDGLHGLARRAGDRVRRLRSRPPPAPRARPAPAGLPGLARGAGDRVRRLRSRPPADPTDRPSPPQPTAAARPKEHTP
ncbi:hypothetical protein AB8O53_18990, partial [Streptomyces pilosus]